MAGATYNGCTYEGGFQGMKPSGEARLIVTGDQFVLRRPRVFFSRSLYKLWAKWTAVTEVQVTAADGGSKLKLTTKARGTGTIVVPDVTPDELWGVLDGLADLRERFHQGGTLAQATTESGPEKATTDKDDSEKAGTGQAGTDEDSDKDDSDKASSQKTEPEKTGADKVRADQTGETTPSSEVQAGGEEAGHDVTGDAGDGEESPAGDEPVGAGAGLAGQDVSGDAGEQPEQADKGDLPGAAP